MLRFIDLFAGVGGLTEGFRNAVSDDGTKIFDPALLVDADATARESHIRNYPGTNYLLSDVSKLKPKTLKEIAGFSKSETVPALIGGPPCQGFSRLSKQGRSLLNDPRNRLFKYFLTIVRELQPQLVLIENVPNFLEFDSGFYLEFTFNFLQKNGYDVAAQVLSANEYGVPQLRKRAFVVALKKGLVSELTFPVGSYPPLRTARELNAATRGLEDVFFSPPFVSVVDAIGDLPRLVNGGSAFQYASDPFTDYQAARRRKAKGLYNHSSRVHTKEFLEKIKRIPEGGSNQDLDGRRRFDRGREIKYLSQAYGRLHRHGIAQTITAHFSNPGSGRFTHPQDLRSITVREAARFQSFDDSFMFYGQRTEQQRQVGNAVPPLLSRALAEHFGRMLMYTKKGKQAQLKAPTPIF